MKKSLLLMGAVAAMLTANAQEAPKPILQDVTPWGYNFDNYEDGAIFKVHSGQGGNAAHACWSPLAGIYDAEAVKTDGHFTCYSYRGDATRNSQDFLDKEVQPGITVRDFGGYLGKCLVINQAWSPLASAIGAADDIYGAGNAPWAYIANGGSSSHALTFYCDKDSIHHDWAGHAIRVRLVFNVLRRGCHKNSQAHDEALQDAYGFSEILAKDNIDDEHPEGLAGGWYAPGAEYDPSTNLRSDLTVPAYGSEFARWENEGTCLAEMPENPTPLMMTGVDPFDNVGHTNSEDTPHYQMQLDRFMVYEWDVYMSGPNQNLKVMFDFRNANASIVIKEIKFFNITNSRDLLVFENEDQTGDFTYGPNSLLEKRQKSWRYYTEKGVKEFAEGGETEEPGEGLADGEYFFRNVKTGYYLTSGMTWGTLAVVKAQPRALNLKANADGTYNVTSSLGSFKPSGEEMYMDGDGTVATTITPVEGGYTISVDGKYLAANEHFNWMTTDWHKDQAHCDEADQYTVKLAAEANEDALWEVVTREDLIAAFENATADKPAEASFLLKGANIAVKDADNKAWKYTVNGTPAEIVFPEGGWGSGMSEWHNNDTYAWLVNDEPEADGEDVVSQEVEGVPAGTYVATYRVVNQDNTPLTLKFNNVEAEAHAFTGTDLWHNSVCAPLKEGVKTAKFTVGEDGKLSIKMVKQSKAGEQNRFAFKHVFLSYIGEAEAAEQDGLTAETAWEISTPEDIEAMKDKVSAATPTYFKLMNDIDMTGVNHVPTVGSANNDFGKTIHFDGNNHVISNLTSVAENEEFYYASLFGVFTGSVKNLGLVDVELKSQLGVAGIGGYVGYGTASTVDNCYVTGKVESLTAYAAGLMGTNSADVTISNSYAQVDVKGAGFAGGLVGRGRNTITLSNCYVSGTVGAVEEKTPVMALVGATDKTDGSAKLVCNNVVAVNTGATDNFGNYGTAATGTIGTDINAVKTWAAFNEGKLFNDLPALNWQDVDASGIDAVVAEDNADAPVEYYNLQGIRVENPANGLYIRKQGSKATKVFVR